MGIRVVENIDVLAFNMNGIIHINSNGERLDKESFKAKLIRNNECVNIINSGSYYKINNFSKDSNTACWQVVSRDKSEILLTFNNVKLDDVYNFKRIKLKGLNEDAIYINKETNEVFLGGALMHCGVSINKLYGNHFDNIIHLKML